MSEQREVIFVLDGGSMGGPCSIKSCAEYASGNYLILDADSMEQVATVDLCAKHGNALATGQSFASVKT